MDILIKNKQTSFNNSCIKIPPSKSIAHRMIICAALSNGESVIENVDFSQDILATINAMEKAGAIIEKNNNTLKITGVFNGSFNTTKPLLEVFCNESGSTLRFLIPLFSALFSRETKLVFTGAGRLLQRPQTIYETIFKKIGIEFNHTEEKIETFGGFCGGKINLDGNVSSQFISGILMAAVLCKKDSIIKINPPFESKPYVDLTIDCFKKFGVIVTFVDDNTIFIKGGQQFLSQHLCVEGDYSQMAFWAVLGCLKGDLRVEGINKNSLQGDMEILNILKNSGCEFEFLNNSQIVFKKSNINSVFCDISNCPDLGPILTVLAAFSNKNSKITGTKRLKIKESDRAFAMKCELEKIGINYDYTENQISINCSKNISNYSETQIVFESHNDHRIAMSCAVAGLCKNLNSFIIKDANSVNKSYPSFWDDLKLLGVEIIKIN
ncbi:MAG: 3-phosphoshikimate 1-carboxyvinyltransferase [Oscillospiraceae bacterium]